MVYAYGLGVDYQDGLYTVYTQLIDLGTPSKPEEGGKSGSPQSQIVWATGKNIDEASFNIYKKTHRRIFWGHISYILLTEEALKKGGQQQIIDILDRYSETRYHIWFYATKEPVKEILQASKFPSKLSTPKISFEQSSFIKPITMREVILAIDEPGHEAPLPSVSTEHSQVTEGEAQIVGVRFNGVTIITANYFKGFLSEREIVGYRWMTKETQRGQLSIMKDGKTVASMVILNVKPKIIPRIQSKGKTRFEIEVKVSARVSTLYERVTSSFLIKEISKLIEKEVMETYLTSLNKHADIYQLSETLYREKVNEWKKISHNGKVPLDEHSIQSINVKVEIQNSNQLHLRPTLE